MILYFLAIYVHIYSKKDEGVGNMEKVRVMLADDNRSILRLITDYLSRCGDVEIVAAAQDGTEIAETVRRLCPDVLVMDVIMPRRDGCGNAPARDRVDRAFAG